MSYKLKVRQQAGREYLEAVDWYAEESPGLATRFTAAIGEVLQSIQENPLRYALVHGEVRRALARHFPYGVFFRVDHDVVVVLAIIHLARSPDIWMKRR